MGLVTASAFAAFERAVEDDILVIDIGDVGDGATVGSFDWFGVAVEANLDGGSAHECGITGAGVGVVAIEAGAFIVLDDGVSYFGMGCDVDDAFVAGATELGGRCYELVFVW